MTIVGIFMEPGLTDAPFDYAEAACAAIETAAEVLGNGERHGGQKKLAVLLNLQPGAVTAMKKRRIPAEHVIVISRATNNKVSPQEMRPDLYPSEE